MVNLNNTDLLTNKKSIPDEFLVYLTNIVTLIF